MQLHIEGGESSLVAGDAQHDDGDGQHGEGQLDDGHGQRCVCGRGLSLEFITLAVCAFQSTNRPQVA